jgi:16S rRNA (uracil1498-N3)-methyltransferase
LAAGPEGGFSGAEVTRFLEAGFKAIRMGDTVLRSETAALYGIAAVRIILLERTAWMLKKK